MDFLNVEANSLTVNLVIFAICAAAIWLAGTRLAYYGDAIAAATGLDKAFLGMVLMAAGTSLGDLAATLTAVLIGNPALAMNNIFGGIVFQTAILALADLMTRRGALTVFTPEPVYSWPVSAGDLIPD